MARKIVSAVLLVVACAGAGPAEAQGLRGWLDRLSGPGPFEGYGVSVEPVCYGVRWLRTQVAVAGAGRELTWQWNCDRDQWRLDIGVEVLFLHANRNPLSYSGNPSSESREVDLRTVVPYVDFVPWPWLEVGAGIGVGWFSGDLFETNAKLLIEPARVTVKPLVLLFADRHPALAILQLRGLLTTFPGGFDAADFGADASWRVGSEVLPSWQIVIDVGEVLWAMPQRRGR